MTGRPRVLVVEDNEAVSDVLCAILDEQYDVSHAGSADAALRELAVQTIDALLLDYQLPGGCGQSVADYATRAHVPMIWMTGDPEAVSALNGASHPLLSKPFGAVDLLRTLAGVLRPR